MDFQIDCLNQRTWHPFNEHDPQLVFNKAIFITRLTAPGNAPETLSITNGDLRVAGHDYDCDCDGDCEGDCNRSCEIDESPQHATAAVRTSSARQAEADSDGHEMSLSGATAALQRAIETNTRLSVVAAWYSVIHSWTLRWQKAFQRQKETARNDDHERDGDDHHDDNEDNDEDEDDEDDDGACLRPFAVWALESLPYMTIQITLRAEWELALIFGDFATRLPDNVGANLTNAVVQYAVTSDPPPPELTLLFFGNSLLKSKRLWNFICAYEAECRRRTREQQQPPPQKGSAEEADEVSEQDHHDKFLTKDTLSSLNSLQPEMASLPTSRPSLLV